MAIPPAPPRRLRRRLIRLTLLLGVLAMTACTLLLRPNRPLLDYPASPQAVAGKFGNPVPRPPMGVGQTLALLWEFTFNRPAGTVPAQAPRVLPLTPAELEAAPDRSLFRLGHSTVLLKLRGGYWITDPVFAE